MVIRIGLDRILPSCCKKTPKKKKSLTAEESRAITDVVAGMGIYPRVDIETFNEEDNDE